MSFPERGTQRLPRYVGLAKAIEMMLTLKPITSEEGKELGLINSIVSHEQLLSTARRWALDIVERRRPWTIGLHRTDKLESFGETREIIKFARSQAKKTTPNLEHPLLCLDAIEEGVVSGGLAGILKEEAAFTAALCSDMAKALTHIFFAQRPTSKVLGVTDIGLKPTLQSQLALSVVDLWVQA